MECGQDKQIVRWVENLLNIRAQKVMIIGQRPATSSVLQGSVLGPVVLNLFINGLGDGTVCTLSKFAGVTWLGGVGDTAEGGAAVQRDLDSWTNGLMGTS